MPARTTSSADRAAADLLERLALVEGAGPAASLVLEHALALTGLERGAVVVWADGMVRAVDWGVDPQLLSAVEARIREDPPPTPAALGASDSSGRAAGTHEVVAEVFRRCAPARCWQLENARVRLSRLERQHDLLTRIKDTLPDPVLLTGPDNAILMANRRAQRLFSFDDGDSEGRRRAIQVNTLLFSSFLTRALIGRGMDSGARELILVDPMDGSDLVFEILSDPVAQGTAGDGAVLSILRDITDLKRAVTETEDQVRRSRLAEHQARHERDQLDALLENVSDPVLVTDEHSNIILMNREADRLFVVDPGTSQETPTRLAVQANDTRFTTLIGDFLLSPDQRRVVKIDVTDPDTRRLLPVEVASSKVLDARGEARAIVSILHDLTPAAENERLPRELRELNADLEARIRGATEELEDRNRRLQWQSSELERAYRLKSEFLASMSHELRTPINLILGYTSLARERIYGELTPQQELALDKIYGTSQHLLELIDDILDLSRIEAGKMPLHLERVSLADIISETAATIEPMISRKRLDFETCVEDGLPSLLTDRTKLRQILLNLLTNAIKFTHQGRITVSAGPAAEPGRVRLVVADTGIGIRPDHLDMIFDDFRQVDQARTREYGGTGLGLSITRKLLMLLGGVIAVESDFGKGTSFAVDLPVRTEPASLEDPARRAAVDADRAALKP